MTRKWDSDEDDKGGLKRKWDVATPGAAPEKQSDSVKIDELIRRVEPLIEQVNNLYQMFATGVERLPPHEKRKLLETTMQQLLTTPKPNPTYNFRVSTLNTHYMTLRDKWDRTLRDIESGKIKRTAGPKKG